MLPRINESGFIVSSPAEVSYTFYVLCVVIELLHCCLSKILKSLAIAVTIWEKLEESNDSWKASRGKGKEVGSKGRAMMGCGNSSQTEDMEGALGEMGDKIPTVNTTLMDE